MDKDIARLVERLEAGQMVVPPHEFDHVWRPNNPDGKEAASTIRALDAKFDVKDEECSHAWACWQEERDRVNALEAQVHEQAVEIKRLREWVAVCNVERKERDEAQAKLTEAVEVITSAPVRPDCDWKCKECNCGVRAWDDRRDAFLATMEKPSDP